jgi:peptide/nickel transport system substrate-binding protein/oligopeptide transport system substrate-binding protein
VRARSAAAALSTILVLTACPESPAPVDTPTPTPPTSPVAGGTLTVAVRDLVTFDPARATDTRLAAGRGTLSALSQVFEPLTRVDPETNRVEPAAATRWRVSRNRLVWRFFLANRTFHNRRRVTAADFKFSFDRLARTRNAEAAFQLEQVEGFAQANAGNRRSLAGVSVHRPTVLQIRLQRPFSELAYNLAHPALVPIPRALYRRSARGLLRSPVGNGPFRVDRTHDAGATLVPYDGYRGTTPYLERIEYRVVRSVEAGWRAYRAGEVQIADIPPAAVDPSGALYGDEGFTPFWATLSFGFNLRRPIFRKPIVRRAISLAIDRQAIATTIYGNTRDPATGLIPRGVRGFVADACSACAFSETRAERILDAAFPRRKPTLSIDFYDERSSRQVARAIQTQLEAVGLRVGLRAHQRRDYLDVLQTGRFDLAQLGWLSDVPSPDPFLHQQLRTNQLNNHTGFANPQFDQALDRARRDLTEKGRLYWYRRAERIALEAMPQIPIVFYRNRTAVADEVQDFFLNGAGLFDGTRVWLVP